MIVAVDWLQSAGLGHLVVRSTSQRHRWSSTAATASTTRSDSETGLLDFTTTVNATAVQFTEVSSTIAVAVQQPASQLAAVA